LAPVLGRARSAATELLRRATRKPPTPPVVDPPIIDPPKQGGGDGVSPAGRITVSAASVDEAVEQVRAFAAEHDSGAIEVTWRIVP
jgi:hypothetical protein